MKKITAMTLILISTLLVSNCTQGEKKISLRFKFEAGQKLHYEQKTNVREEVFEGDSTLHESSDTYTVSIDQEFIKFVDDTAAEVSERAVWHFMRPSKEDSTKIVPHESERTVIMTTLPNGKVIDIQFLDLKEQSRIRYIMNYYEQGLPVFPSGEKPVGYSWNQTTKVVLPEESMEASMTYQIKSLVREAGYDCAVIEYNGNLVIPIEPNTKDSTLRGGLDRIQSKGLLYFAYREGVVVSQKESWTVNGDRTRLKDGKMVNFKFTSHSETEYVLKNRSVGE